MSVFIVDYRQMLLS